MRIQLSTKDNWLSSAGYSKEEQEEIYQAQLNDIIQNTRWYLDNLDYMVEYRLDNGNYI